MSIRVTVFTSIIGLATFVLSPAQAEQSEFLIPGSVLCNNYDPVDETCRTITEVTRVEGNLRYSRSRRKVALPDESLLLETEGISQVDGLRVCGVRPTAEPRITPADSKFAEAVMTVHTSKRDFRIARGDCVVYKPCGSDYHLFLIQDGKLDDRQRSLTTIFYPGDPRIDRVTLRGRIFGIPEAAPSDCEPIS